MSRRVERILRAHAWLLFVFLYAPILVLVIYSFNDSRTVSVWTEPSLRWYRELLGDEAVLAAVRNSLVVAALSTAVSTVLGTAAALGLDRRRFRGRGAVEGLLALPLIVPDVTMAVMMLVFFSAAFGGLNDILGTRLGLGLGSVTASHVAFSISYVALVVRARLARLDPALEEAAVDLYAGPWQAFRRVTLPLLRPGIAAGALLALTVSLDDVVVTSFVSGPGSTTLPVYVFGLVRRGVTPLVNAVSALMLVASMGLVAVALVGQNRPLPTEESDP